MNLKEAYDSGRPFRLKGDNYWLTKRSCVGRYFDVDRATSEDWEVKENLALIPIKKCNDCLHFCLNSTDRLYSCEIQNKHPEWDIEDGYLVPDWCPFIVNKDEDPVLFQDKAYAEGPAKTKEREKAKEDTK